MSSDIQSGTLQIRGRAYRPIHADYMKAMWEAQNPLLQRGEIGIEQDTHKFKVGDGTTKWNDLPYSSGSKGDPGTTFTPSVNADGDLSWTNDGGLPNPETVNIMGPEGPQGPEGPLGTNAPIVTTISSASTDLEVCSAKCVYNTVGIINNALNVINNGVQP